MEVLLGFIDIIGFSMKIFFIEDCRKVEFIGKFLLIDNEDFGN